MTGRAQIDHFALSAETLEEGAAAVEAALGVKCAPGGAHPTTGTHNMLLGLGPVYLEVIAINPDAPPPKLPPLFDLAGFTGPPRLTSWIARVEDLEAALPDVPEDMRYPEPLARGDLSWRMTFPRGGKLPFDGLFPALIQWQGPLHPTARIPDSGCRLKGVEISHPEPKALSRALAQIFEPVPAIVCGGAPAIRIEIETPNGIRVLQ